MFIIKTESPMFATSVPNKSFKSFVRALCAMKYVVEKRAAEYGYELKEYIAYEVDERTFSVEYFDTFGFLHSFQVVEVEE